MASPRLLLSSALIAAASAAVPSAAHAGVLSGVLNSSTGLLPSALVASDNSCVDGAESNPFAPWHDNSDYVAAPSGSFESGLSGWTSSGRVSVANENEPWNVDGNDDDHQSAAISAGSTLNSDDFCGGIDHPTIRFFAKSSGKFPATALVTVRYTGRDGHLLAALPLGIITAGSSWAPANTTATLSGLKLLTGAHLGLSITALTGTVLVDDVYVDPYRRS